MLSWLLAGIALAEGVVIVTLIERINAVKAAHDADHAAEEQAKADRDAQIAALQAKLDAGGLTADEESALEALEADLGTNPPAPNA